MEGRCALLYAGRAPAAAPATGIGKIHDTEQHALVDAALHATVAEKSARRTNRLKPDAAASRARKAGATPLRKRS